MKMNELASGHSCANINYTDVVHLELVNKLASHTFPLHQETSINLGAADATFTRTVLLGCILPHLLAHLDWVLPMLVDRRICDACSNPTAHDHSTVVVDCVLWHRPPRMLCGLKCGPQHSATMLTHIAHKTGIPRNTQQHVRVHRRMAP